jgi:S-DNA-T family DNA segregation ATPase FtsK/SpoIIIE
MIPGGPYTLPPIDLLDEPVKEAGGMSEENLVASSRLLEKKLIDFHIEGQVVAVTSGPIITMFEYEPAPGVKISQVANLADDLAMSMRAASIRIVAPLPGKGVIGVEMPNPTRETVFLRELISSKVFQDSRSLLTLVMGVDILGQPEVADLRRMPHLLVAGATGTGKSVGLNAMILSILFKARPDEVRFLMIDPKRIELSPYNDLPHLIYPVITDPKQANQALKWAAAEMEERYRLLAEKGARNIETYNRKVQQELAQAPAPQERPAGETLGEGGEPLPEPPKPLPYLVIVIDELADLMMVSAREVESSIIRLAQMARAAGIHLILATQRPSVDVLTGLIKANMPTRVSYQVFSKVDSRTILDQIGADQLLGRGDMLFLAPGTGRLRRLHGALVLEDEVKRVTRFIKAQQAPDYRDDLDVFHLDDDLPTEDGEYDEKYEEAVELVTRTGRASISSLQRHLRVGYNRAARMIEIMERDGLVGPADGSRPRQIIVKGS